MSLKASSQRSATRDYPEPYLEYRQSEVDLGTSYFNYYI